MTCDTPIAHVEIEGGRAMLNVAGLCLAVQGHNRGATRQRWDRGMIELAAEEINYVAGQLARGDDIVPLTRNARRKRKRYCPPRFVSLYNARQRTVLFHDPGRYVAIGLMRHWTHTYAKIGELSGLSVERVRQMHMTWERASRPGPVDGHSRPYVKEWRRWIGYA